jgi:hypothetical protein
MKLPPVPCRAVRCSFGHFGLFCLIFVAVAIATPTHAASLVISEFMASNIGGLVDEDGDFGDWIEIYNPTQSPVPLAGWALSDDEQYTTKWIFPAASIPSHGFLTVFADGKNRTNAAAKLHTNFSLDQDGESVLLTDPQGEVVSSILHYPRQLPDVSYGVSMITQSDILFPFNGTTRALVATTAPPADWFHPAFADAAWLAAPMGLGYDQIPPGQTDPLEPPLTLGDVTAPGDIIVATSLNSPANEGVGNAIDNNTGTKYLNFDKLNAGFTVTASNEFAVVIGLKITSANDAPERDPTSFILSGSNGGAFTEIARGPIPAFTARFQTVQVNFPNSAEYQQYNLIFPTVQNAGAANSMQISEIEFLGQSADPAPSFAPYIQTSVESAFYNKATSALVRAPFPLPSGQTLENPTLRLRYDDGFAAWLNGTLVASANTPANFAFNGVAPTNRYRRDAVREVRINLGAFGNLLHAGENVLAIQGWNDRSASADFLLQAQLEDAKFLVGTAGYFTTPTPGAENSQAKVGVVEDVVASEPHGFYSTAFDLSLRTTTPGAVIRYTTNGSAPSLTNGITFTAPIRIDRTTIVRAAAFLENWLTPRVTTASYIFVDDVAKQTQASALAAGLPGTWGAYTADYGLDPRVVGPNDSYSGKYAREIKADLQAIPAISLALDNADMFGPQGIYPNSEAHGEVWERPLSIEMLNPDGAGGFQENAGIRIQGGAFRRFDLTMKKSFRIIFRQEYGAGKLHYDLFGPDAANDFQNIVLRANANDAWPYDGGGALYARDMFAMETVRAMGSVSSHDRFVHVFINGWYWGLYNLVERPDASFSSSYYGDDRSTWDALNQDSAPDGNYDAWTRMLNALALDMSDDANYQRILGNNPDGTRNPNYENLVDVDSLIDYMIMNFYIGNTDWPGRNWWAGRDRNNGDGFKFYPWDSETALGISGVNVNVTGAVGAVAQPYAALRANAAFRMRFADHAYRHFFNGGVFYVNPASPSWDPARPTNNVPAARFFGVSEQIRGAIVGESARWGDQKNTGPFTRDEQWTPSRSSLLTSFFPQRSAIVLNQFRQANLYPKTDAPVMNVHGGTVDAGFQLTMTAAQGAIYYTTNGMDPRMPINVEEVWRKTLVTSNATKKVLVPSTSNGGSTLGAAWQGGAEPFDDAAWQAGAGSVGFDQDPDYRPYIGIDVGPDMNSKNPSAFIRIPFDYDGTDKDRINFMAVRAQCDDGFVAYLNGVRIASTNAPAAVAWNSAAGVSAPETEAVKFLEFRADAGLPALKIGRNILAIQGLNSGSLSFDFLINAELVVGEIANATSPGGAIQYSGPITLNDLTTVKARVLNGSEWSALNEAHFVVGQPNLALNELYFHPTRSSADERAAGFLDNEAFEYIEVWNNGTATYDLSSVAFTRGVQFNFANASTDRLAANGYMLLVSDRLAFEKRFGTGLPVVGVFTGHLDNNGERLQLVDGTNTIFDFTYGTSSPWPSAPDGNGPSLEPINPNGNLTVATNWQASSVFGGSPGRKNPPQGVRLGKIASTGAQLNFTFTGKAGVGYLISATDSLTPPNWQTIRVVDPPPGDQSIDIRIDMEPATPTRFYRVTAQ